MRVRHLFAVCLASVVWSGSANLSLLACEECDSSHACSECCQSDDRGLLDRIDSALMRRQPQLPRGYLPQLPLVRDTFRNGLLGNCGCNASPSCGCELRQASCGCEVTPASCGVEMLNMPGEATTQSSAQPSAPWQSNSSVPVQADIPAPEIAADTFQPRQQLIQRPPAASQIKPLPQHMPAETVPTPESEVDPFRDDSARVLRRVPAQSIQLRPSGSAYRQSYDPQARHESVRMSLSDHELPSQRPTPTSFSQLPRSTFDAHGSSRQAGFTPPAQPREQQPLPSVVTASALTASGYAQQPSSASRQSRNGGGELRAGGLSASRSDNRSPARQPAGAVESFNPLRSSGGR